MGFFDRLSRLLRANLNDLVSKAEDPVKIIDQSVADMQEDLVKLRELLQSHMATAKSAGMAPSIITLTRARLDSIPLHSPTPPLQQQILITLDL